MSDKHDWRRDRKSRKRGSDDDTPQDGGWSMPAYSASETRAFSRQPSAISDPVAGAVVKRFDAERGFGFVAPNDGSKDVFVHATALGRSGTAPLSEGQVVTMQVVQRKKGLEANAIRLE
jgi:CspA family cold shock protein